MPGAAADASGTKPRPRKPKRKAGGGTVWDSANWRPVDIDTTLVTAGDEGGFAGLEELSGEEARVLLASVTGGGAGGATPTDKDSPAAAAAAAASTADLAARVAALETENARLRAGAAPEQKGKRKNKKKQRADPNRGAAARGAPTPLPAAPGAPPLDATPWRELGLCASLAGALAGAGFGAPTHVQALALPPALRDGRDVVGAAPTGSGKTLAFGLPILERLVREGDCGGGEEGHGEGAGAAASAAAPAPPPSPLRALVLAPTRELALQVAHHLRPLARAVGARVAPVVGGVAAPKQARLLKARPHIVVATPGRLWDAMDGGDPHLADLSGLRCLALDEADRLAEAGAYAEVGRVLGRVEGAADLKRLQTFIFSATLTLPDALRRRVKKGGGGAGRGGATLDAVLAGVPLRGKPALVDTAARGTGAGGAGDDAADGAAPAPAPPPSFLADTVTELALETAGGDARDAALYAAVVLATRGGGLFGAGAPPAAAPPPTAGRALVFVNAVSSARRLVALLRILGVPARALHAGTPQRARLKALDGFAADARGVLVATDVAARGLDVPSIALVAHYQLPPTPDTYVHRCGRTGRAGAGGASLALVAPGDAGRWAALRHAFGGGDGAPAPPPPAPAALTPVVLAEAAARVRAAVVVDGAERAAAKASADAAWRARTADAAGVDLSDDDDGGGVDAARLRAAGGPAVVAARARLAAMLRTPLDGGGGGRGRSASAAVAAPAFKAAVKRARGGGGDPRAAALEAAVAAARAGRGKRGRLVVVG